MPASPEEKITPQTAYYRRLSPEGKAAQVDRNRQRKAARSPEQIEIDRQRANANRRLWVAANREHLNKLQRESQARRSRDPVKRRLMILAKVKSRAKAKSMAFNLTVDDIVIPEVCPVLGIPISMEIASGKKALAAYDSPSVDRVNNALGYVKGNVRIISNRANLLKGSATVSELESVCAYMRGEL